MKERGRSWLGAVAPAVVMLLVMVFLLSSSYFLSNGRKSMMHVGERGGQARKLLSSTPPAPSLSSQNQLRTDNNTRKPIKLAGVSFRRIPPSTSNPTQNKSRPRIDGPGNL